MPPASKYIFIFRTLTPRKSVFFLKINNRLQIILIADIRIQKKAYEIQKKAYEIGQQFSRQMNADDDNKHKPEAEAEPRRRTATDGSMRLIRLRRNTVS